MTSDRIAYTATHCRNQQPLPNADSLRGFNLTAAVGCIISSWADDLEFTGPLKPGMPDKLKAAVVLFQPRYLPRQLQRVVDPAWKRGQGGLFFVRFPTAPHIVVAALA